MLDKASSLVSMTESLKFALEKGWYDRAVLLAHGIKKITEILETEIENIQNVPNSLKTHRDLVYEAQI